MLDAILTNTKSQKIEIQSGRAFYLLKDQILKVITPNGFQVADFFCIDPYNLNESFSAHRTLDYNDSIYPTSGSLLYSNRSNVMAEIVEDTSGCHDLLMPPCSLRMFQIVAKNEDYHPSCSENLANSLAPYGVSEDLISGSLNIFMNVKVSSDGAVKINPSTAQPFDYVRIKAHRDLLVALTSCSHEETNNMQFAPIYYEIEKS